MDGQKHKVHRPAQAGAKVEKKKPKEKHQKGFNEKVCVMHSNLRC
jgi:ribosome biogenesis protein BMS1